MRLNVGRIETRTDGPHTINESGFEAWMTDDGFRHWSNYTGSSLNPFHREDGPATIERDGSEYWFFHGKHHREDDGPAVCKRVWQGNRMVWCKMWYKHGILYRANGLPNVVYDNGLCQWWTGSGFVKEVWVPRAKFEF